MKQQYADRILRVREEDIRKVEAEAARERKRVEAETVAELKAISASGDAQALRLKAQAEADAYKMRAYAEADEMRVKDIPISRKQQGKLVWKPCKWYHWKWRRWKWSGRSGRDWSRLRCYEWCNQYDERSDESNYDSRSRNGY